MPTEDADRERINVFPVDAEYYFAHYFDRTDLFEALSGYYNDEAYRFEVPKADFEGVRSTLETAHYDPVIVEDMEPFCVLKEPYTKHARILRNSVAHWERRGQLFFLLKDERSVHEAVELGATRIGDTDYALGL